MSLCAVPLPTRANSSTGRPAPEPKVAVAHYMVCYAAMGTSRAAYAKEIDAAKSMGLDGFALNVGSWSEEPMYKQRVERIFSAAAESAPTFRLFLSLDMSGSLTAADIYAMVRAFASRTNYLRIQGRPVLSTFGGQDRGAAFWFAVLAKLRDAGIHPYFIPYFFVTPVTEHPSRVVLEANYLTRWRGLVDGLFYFGAAGTPDELSRTNSTFAEVARSAGIGFMASITPEYWGRAQIRDGRRYFEFGGGRGLSSEWENFVALNAHWVELVTFNDFKEGTYAYPFAPSEMIGLRGTQERDYTKDHRGYAALVSYYLHKWKADRPPTGGRNFVVYSYRPHSASASVAGDVRVSSVVGQVNDSLSLTTVATEPYELTIGAAGWERTLNIAPGVKTFDVARAGGGMTLTIKCRKASTQVEIPPLIAHPTHYDFSRVAGIVGGCSTEHSGLGLNSPLP